LCSRAVPHAKFVKTIKASLLGSLGITSCSIDAPQRVRAATVLREALDSGLEIGMQMSPLHFDPDLGSTTAGLRRVGSVGPAF
jgi:hypothetical protein